MIKSQNIENREKSNQKSAEKEKLKSRSSGKKPFTIVKKPNKEEAKNVDLLDKRNNVIVDHVSSLMDHLILNKEMLCLYHENKIDQTRSSDLDKSEVKTYGSLSSADERDITVLMCGEHKYQFDAIKKLKALQAKKYQEVMKKIQEEHKDSEVPITSKIKNFLCCRRALNEVSKNKRNQYKKTKMPSLTGWNDQIAKGSSSASISRQSSRRSRSRSVSISVSRVEISQDSSEQDS